MEEQLTAATWGSLREGGAGAANRSSRERKAIVAPYWPEVGAAVAGSYHSFSGETGPVWPPVGWEEQIN